MIFFFLPECNARIPCKLKCLKVSHRRKMKEKKITSKVGQRQIRHRIGFLKLFFSMPRPRRDGSTLTFFWLKYFITMTLLGGFLLKYLKLWLFVFWWPLLIKLTLNNILIKMIKSARAVPPSKKTAEIFFKYRLLSYLSRNTNSPFRWFWILTVRVYPMFFLGNWIFQNSWL